MMNTATLHRADLLFKRPDTHTATMPAEARGLSRDGVRLLVSSPSGHHHTHFYDLASFLRAGDVLVVNRSATLPASLLARGRLGNFMLNLSTRYGRGLWLAEPRWSPSQPGPLPLSAGESIDVAGVRGRLIAPFPHSTGQCRNALRRLSLHRKGVGQSDWARRTGTRHHTPYGCIQPRSRSR